MPGLRTLPPITPAIAGLTLASAACSMLGNLLLIVAYSRAQASRMAPFVYTQLIWATLFGALVFRAAPDGLALVGIVLVAASGLASLWQGRRRD